MSQNSRSKAAITAQNTFSTGIAVGSNRKVTFSLWGTFSATVSLQRKPLGDLDANYRDIGTYTAPVEKVIDNVGNWVYRAGVKTSNYTSGTANVDLIH